MTDALFLSEARRLQKAITSTADQLAMAQAIQLLLTEMIGRLDTTPVPGASPYDLSRRWKP